MERELVIEVCPICGNVKRFGSFVRIDEAVSDILAYLISEDNVSSIEIIREVCNECE